ncbi:unnamed protein product [Paramecium octaurelia]|uniref:Uncharacterized protein n=1 Tax=Paramecium octaurelia TaxID=43137 RepID=A0A8S1S4A9_PAROT|nr:unnamed protein product [Paramecium octaurelia]
MLQLIRVGKRQLVCVPSFNYKLRRPAPKMSEYDKERIEYKHLMNQYRSRIVKDFWEEQTKIENQYIDDFLAKEKAKQERLDIHRRNQTVIQTFNATQQFNKLQDIRRVRNERVKKYLVEQDIKKMNRQQIIRVLNEESKNWISDKNSYEKLVGNLLIPDTVLDEISYYHDLQEKAILYETAQYEEIDKLNDPNIQLEWKNRLGMPLYQRIVTLIKFLKQDNVIGNLKFEWDTCQAIILTDKKLSEKEMAEQLDKVNGAFQTVIAQKIEELENNPVKRLEEMNKQLIRLYNLLELWDKYITIVKMDNSTAQQIMQAAKAQINLFESEGGKDYMITSDNSLIEKLNGKEAPSKEEKDDKYISADETHTDSEDIDLENLQKKKETKDIYGGRTTKSYDFDTERIKDKDKEFSKLVEELFAKAEAKAKESNLEFESNYRKNPHQKVFYNDNLNAPNVPDARSVFEGVDLEQLFPSEILNDETKTPYLDFKNVEDIENHYYELKAIYSLRKQGEQNILMNPDVQKFNTTITAQTYKQILNNLDVPQEYSKLKQDTQKLVDAVGEIKVTDADFLLKIWNYYN